MNKKNKVYFAQGDEDYGGAFIAAKTSKEARLFFVYKSYSNCRGRFFTNLCYGS